MLEQLACHVPRSRWLFLSCAHAEDTWLCSTNNLTYSHTVTQCYNYVYSGDFQDGNSSFLRVPDFFLYLPTFYDTCEICCFQITAQALREGML